MPPRVLQKTESFRSSFEASLTPRERTRPTAEVFLAKYDVSQLPMMLDQGREKMVTNDISPTATIARYAFGTTIVKGIIEKHLLAMTSAMGVTSTPDGISEIANDIMSGYGDLKLTEIILALKMIREGKFREGIDGNRNRGEFYGTLSSGVICDCLNRFRFEYRNPILERIERERKKREMEEHDAVAVTYDTYRDSVFASVLCGRTEYMMAKLLEVHLKKNDMATLEYYAAERKALLLLRQRVEEYIMAVDAANETSEKVRTLPEYESLVKGIKYITDKFPYDVVDAASGIAK